MRGGGRGVGRVLVFEKRKPPSQTKCGSGAGGGGGGREVEVEGKRWSVRVDVMSVDEGSQ